ncbi:hypothetical protein [Paracoccus alkanivorans]|uniref:hypothetical protein n=1 Tax=Paracoccus alkanivorans TaxID=2116655 RepID=UPI0011C363FB|nr:hypothetical protein [Paracoccus alkanivorans]
MTPIQQLIFWFLTAIPLANYGLRLFHLRLFLLPVEQQVLATLPVTVSEELANWAMSWLEFALICVLNYAALILVFLFILVREIIWRLRTKPAVTLVTVKLFLLMGGLIAVMLFVLFLFLHPEAAKGTRADVPRPFAGAMITFATLGANWLIFFALIRPQHLDHLLRLQIRQRR